MLAVKVTVAMGKRTVDVDEVRDKRIAGPMKAAGRDLGKKLETIECPSHHKTASNVHIHFDARGSAHLKYESCCEELGKAIGTALGS